MSTRSVLWLLSCSATGWTELPYGAQVVEQGGEEGPHAHGGAGSPFGLRLEGRDLFGGERCGLRLAARRKQSRRFDGGHCKPVHPVQATFGVISGMPILQIAARGEMLYVS